MSRGCAKFKGAHDHSICLPAVHACKHQVFSEPPSNLAALVTDLESFEVSETWVRYESSESEERGVLHHVKNEGLLALVDLQKKLEAVSLSSAFRFDGTETFDTELYYAWLRATESRVVAVNQGTTP